MNVLTLGTFDTPHMGHAAFLRRCEQFGDVTVGLNSDRFIEVYKGAKPLFGWRERARLLNEFGVGVVENDGPGRQLIQHFKPDVLAIGSDWLHKDYLGQIGCTPNLFDALSITLVYVPYTPGISTSILKVRCG